MIQILGLVLLYTGAAAGLLCTLVPGNLTQIDAGAGQVYGVNYDDNIFQWVGTYWKQIPGKLIHVTVGPAGVWGVDRMNYIFKLQDDDWLPVNGHLKQIDAGGNKFLSGANKYDWVYCLDQDQTVSTSDVFSYTELDGSLKYYSCGPYGCWGVNRYNDIYYRHDVKPTECWGSYWQQIRGSLVMVEVGTDGSVYGVNPQGTALKRKGISAMNPTGISWSWLDMPVSLQHVSYDEGNLWLLTQNGDIFKCRANGF
ncbi:fish-egg lectin-like [Hyla sarda]|uniref:fish-egg lectin-like n=1 Tax=Hyla sarda TaxID=327740 RepID=UPI0024C2DEDA|nr:fish-egg lectin-like [Hyla sarda]